MMKLEFTGQFKKDLKKYKHKQALLAELEKVLRVLQQNGAVPTEYRPHALFGNYSGCMECHVLNDFLLIWIDKYEPIIKLVRLGSHSELFK